MFCSRIVRAEYESKETFLSDKYSEYNIELPKMDDFTKGKLAKEYYDLWDLCRIFRAKIKEHEEEIKMQAITNPIALELASEVKKAVAPNEFVNETLNRKNELEQLREYMIRREQNIKQKSMEEMLLSAILNNATSEVIEAMRRSAGITEIRLSELKKQASSV